MKHAACHFTVSPLTRGKTAGAVARAAYIARCRLHDERTGQTFSYTRRGGLLAEGTVNWDRGIEVLWNEVERSETRKNSRVAREIRMALPAELPLPEMRRVVHGYCCNLVDRYGLAAQWVIHTPRFHDRNDGRRVERLYRQGRIDQNSYLAILSDPERTNRNFHGHILISNRQINHDTGTFADKIRCLDNIKTGPEEIRDMRDEWELRTNAALKRTGSKARVDLRSYGEMAAAGDAPEGLVAQPHVGSTASHGAALHYPVRAKTRKKIQNDNDEIWATWEQRRSLERERSRLQASERIAAKREEERKAEAAAEKQKIVDAQTEQEAQAAANGAVHISSPLGSIADVIAMAQSGEKMEMPPGEDIEIDLETYEPPSSTTPFHDAIKVKRRTRVRVRSRSG